MPLKIPNALKPLVILGLLQLVLGCAGQKPKDSAQAFVTEPLTSPVPDDATEQRLVALPNGDILVYWWQDRPDKHSTLQLTTLTGGHWTAPKPVASMDKVTDARITPVGDDTLAALWLVSQPLPNGAGEIQALYLAYGDKTGERWTPPIPLDRHGAPSNKESPVLAELADGSLLAAWIDLPLAGAAASNAAIKATRIHKNGAAADSLRIDESFCACCHLALIDAGPEALLAYRDLRGDNLRDPAIVRISASGPGRPELVHDDHWRIDGCPATGPGIARFGDTVAVAWLTEVGNRYVVRAAFSRDRGRHFDPPRDLAADVGALAGIVMDAADSAWVAWTGFDGNGEAVKLARIFGDGRIEQRGSVLALGAGKAFRWPGPSLAKIPGAVLIAWQEQQTNQSGLLQVEVAP